jgi:uncharacterized protein YunC (DUF1805 family)
MATHEKVKLAHKLANGYTIPLGPFNLVAIATDKGMICCGAFDVLAMDKYSYPAARVRSATGSSISTTNDLMAGIVKDANDTATRLGINIGMSGKEALDKL